MPQPGASLCCLTLPRFRCPPVHTTSPTSSAATVTSADPGSGASTPGRQALLALAYLRNGDTYTRLACGFEIGVSTAWRLRPRSRRPARRSRRRPGHRDGKDPRAGVRDPRRHPDPDRPHRRSEAPLLRKTPTPRRERAGSRRRGRPPRLGLSVAARFDARPERCSHPRHHRRAEQRERDEFAHKAYQGARGSIRTPFKRRRCRPKPSRRQ
jgi:hypothetical protein